MRWSEHLAFTDPDDPATRPNQMRLLFLDPHTRELHRDSADEAASAVASLRFVAGQYPDDRALAELVGELSMNSREFACLWAKHDVRLCSSGTKRLHHPQVGDVDLHYEVLHLSDRNGQRLLTHTATVGSATAMRRRCSGEAGRSSAFTEPSMSSKQDNRWRCIASSVRDGPIRGAGARLAGLLQIRLATHTPRSRSLTWRSLA